eukprot:scaffold1983_cov107-Isochrysis_galbana.AAC.1
MSLKRASASGELSSERHVAKGAPGPKWPSSSAAAAPPATSPAAAATMAAAPPTPPTGDGMIDDGMSETPARPLPPNARPSEERSPGLTTHRAAWMWSNRANGMRWWAVSTPFGTTFEAVSTTFEAERGHRVEKLAEDAVGAGVGERSGLEPALQCRLEDGLHQEDVRRLAFTADGLKHRLEVRRGRKWHRVSGAGHRGTDEGRVRGAERPNDHVPARGVSGQVDRTGTPPRYRGRGWRIAQRRERVRGADLRDVVRDMVGGKIVDAAVDGAGDGRRRARRRVQGAATVRVDPPHGLEESVLLFVREEKRVESF